MEHRSNHIVGYLLIVYTILPVLGVLMYLPGHGQQKPQFTQYISNELLINPAYAGAAGALDVSLFHRAQWSAVEGAPTTQALTAHSLFKSANVGAGITLINDNIGINNVLNISPSFSYRIQLQSETFLSFGMQIGINQKTTDYNSLNGQVQNPNDPNLNVGNLSETTFELGSGVYLMTPRLNLGISMPNMLYKPVSADSLDNKLLNNNLYFMLRYRIPISSMFVLQPGVLIRYTNNAPLYMDFNLSAVLNNVLLVGVSYRLEQSVNPIIQAKITPQLKLGYAFDYPLSSQSSFGSNSHEFMVSYLFSFSKQNVSRLR